MRGLCNTSSVTAESKRKGRLGLHTRRLGEVTRSLPILAAHLVGATALTQSCAVLIRLPHVYSEIDFGFSLSLQTLSLANGISNIGVDAIDKEIETNADQKHQPGEDRSRQSAAAFACQK